MYRHLVAGDDFGILSESLDEPKEDTQLCNNLAEEHVSPEVSPHR